MLGNLRPQKIIAAFQDETKRIQMDNIYVLYSWHVKARIYRRRSKRRRIEVFTVPASDREFAKYQIQKHFKGVFCEEILELKPVNVINAFYKDSLEWLTKEELSKLTIPSDL